MTAEPAPRPTEAERWASDMGEKWNTHVDRFEGMLAPIGKALIDAAEFQPGEHVIDIGCGAGPTTLEIARRVGPTGSATGLDISPALVTTAKRRAAQLGIDNARFQVGDASVADVGGARFDYLFSRFGIMFFSDPYAAFAHLHEFLRPGGRVMFACWGPQQQNPWVVEVMGLIQKYVELPPPPPRAPGPFAFGDESYLRDILGKADFKDVTLTAYRGEQYIGGPGSNAASAARFLTETLFVGEMLKNLPEERRKEAEAELVELLARHEKDGSVQMGGMAWFVGARA
jgi:SAM-dependent methyltransferase